MKRLFLFLLLFLGFAVTGHSQAACTESAVINVTSGNTGQLVALSGDTTYGTTISVCGLVITGSAAGTGAQFQTGTGTTCGTGTVNLTGVMLMPANGSIASGLVFVGSKGAALCLAATTGNVTGVVSYRRL